MAPKAKADAAPKKKAVKKTEEESAEPKVPQPDRQAFDAKVADVQKVIDDLQKQQKALTEKIQERSGGRDEFQQQKAAIFAELEVVNGKLNDLNTHKEGLQKNVTDLQAEGREKRQQLGKLKKSIGYTDESEIDGRIKEIEFQLLTESMPLKEEKKLMAEISELKRNRPKVGQVAAMEQSLGELQGASSIKEQLQQLNSDMYQLREERRAISARLDALKEGRSLQVGDMPQLVTQREELSKQVQEQIKERNAIRDEFRQAERDYNAYLAEQRKVRQEKYNQEREARNKEYDMIRRKREADKLDEQPHVAEITLIEQTQAFCRSLTASKGPVEKEKAREIEHDKFQPEGTEVLLKKEDRDEFYFAPTKGKKGGKKKAAKGDAASKPIKHNAETFRLFSQLGLDAPITTDDIAGLMEKLDAQMESYQEKIKAWEKNRDERKRKILEEGIFPEEEKKAEEPAAEAEAEKGEEEAAAPAAEEEGAEKEDD